jgi:hypothetical protein
MRIVLAVVVANLIGCTAEEPPAGYPVGTDPLPSEGGYMVESHVVMSLGSADVDSAIAQLLAFSQHGGTTLMAQSVGTASGQALDALPTTLRSKLEGWIDVELDKQKLGTVTARVAIGDISMMAQTVVNEFVLESSLTITPTGAVHSLHDLNFKPDSLDVVVPIGGLTDDQIMQKPTSDVSASGALVLGDEHFKLALGSHAWQGINLGVTTKYGGDLSIVQNLDCNAVAQSVAARCVSTSCVGHASDILAVCQLGMTTLVGQLRDGLAPIVLESLRFTHGTAQLVDDNHDGVAEKIEGTWDAEADLGIGASPMQIAFTALAD